MNSFLRKESKLFLLIVDPFQKGERYTELSPLKVYPFPLNLLSLQTNIDTFANSAVPGETACNLSHWDLHCHAVIDF